MPSFTTPNSAGRPDSPLREEWSDAARKAAAAGRIAKQKIFAKPLGPRNRLARVPHAVHQRLDRKYSKHDIVDQSTGEVTNPKVDRVLDRFRPRFKKSTFRATLKARRAAKPYYIGSDRYN